MARQNIKEGNPELLDGRLQLQLGDGRLGFAELGPYNAIHVGAAAPHLPQALIEQLKVCLASHETEVATIILSTKLNFESNKTSVIYV